MRADCNLCGRTLSLKFVRRCYRCNKFFCRSCMIGDFTSEDHNLICLNCAKRIVSPGKVFTKYSPLKDYLVQRKKFSDTVTLSFERIEGIISDTLPFVAMQNPGWWSNTESSIQGKVWMSAGWKIDDLNLKDRIVTFKRLKKGETSKKRKDESKRPYTPPPIRVKTRRKPSKTRTARIQAKYLNLKRRRSSIRSYKGKFKPKSAYEKRLYKSEEKPKIQDG